MKKTIRVYSDDLASNLANHATIDELVFGNESNDYNEEEELYQLDGKFLPSVQDCFDGWLAFYEEKISHYEVTPQLPLYFNLNNENGVVIGVIRVDDKNLEQMIAKIKIAVQEERNCVVQQISEFELFQGLESKTCEIDISFRDEDEDFETEDEMLTFTFNETWIY